MRVDVLGPLRITIAGEPLPLSGSRVRSALSWLVINANQPVGLVSLAGIVWERPPSDAAHRLRTLLRGVAIRLPRDTLRVGAAARLALVDGAVDAERFAGLIAEGYRHWSDGDPGRAGADVDEALALLRGTPYPDLEGCTQAAPEIERLNRLVLDATEMHQEVALQGQVDFTTVADLRYLVGSHPHRRRLRLQLARALYLTGRQVEALQALRQASADLGDGTDFGRLVTMVLRRDPDLAVATSIPARGRGRRR